MSDSSLHLGRLRKAEVAGTQFREFLESMPDALVIVDSEGHIVSLNRQTEVLFGYGRNELLGKPVETLLPERLREAHASHRDAYHSKPHKRPMGVGRDSLVGRRRDGSEFPADISLSPLETNEGVLVMAAIRDITEPRRAEETIREQAAFLKSTLDALSHPFYVIDANDYTIKMANAAARFGESSSPKTCYTLTHRVNEPCSGHQHICPLQEVKRTKAPTTVEHIHYDKDGNARIYEVHCHPIFDGEGNVKEVIEYNLDITERKQAEEALRQAHTETVMLLAAAAEARDRTTGLHLQSVRAVTEALARELGYGEQEARELGLAAVLHDIGKIRVRDSILASSGRLTEKEWELMKHHTTWGEEFLTGRPGFTLAATIARSHHERWDGGGYPDGLAGEAIPEAATIVAVADSLDAMTSNRSYRTMLSLDEALAAIVACSGTQFSPKVVAALVRLYVRDALPRKPVEASEQEAAA